MPARREKRGGELVFFCKFRTLLHPRRRGEPFLFLYPFCHMRAGKSPESEQAIDPSAKISRIGDRNTLDLINITKGDVDA